MFLIQGNALLIYCDPSDYCVDLASKSQRLLPCLPETAWYLNSERENLYSVRVCVRAACVCVRT